MKAIDGMLGLAIGDAMGVPLEFRSRDSLLAHPVTKMTGFGNYDLPKGVWSDDTALSLATLDSLTKHPKIDYNDMFKRFCKWVHKASYSSTGEIFDIGTTTKFALMRYYNDSMPPLKCGGTSITDNGNGSLMRMFPVAYYCYIKGLTDEQTEYVAITISSLTHAHAIACLGCYIYIKYVVSILSGNDKITSYNNLKNVDYGMFKKDTLKVYKRILVKDISRLTIDDIKSDGYIVNTLEAVLWVILNTDTYAESIVAAINLGGDTDTVGSITGSIAGVLYGVDQIPVKWSNDLINAPYIWKMCSKFEDAIK